MFNKVTYDIVQFKDGKFGYRRTTKGLFTTKYEFKDVHDIYWYKEADYINSWCKFDNKKRVVDFIERDNNERKNRELSNVLDIGIITK